MMGTSSVNVIYESKGRSPGTKYLNEIFILTREARNGGSGALGVSAVYSQLGDRLTIQVSSALGCLLLHRLT